MSDAWVLMLVLGLPLAASATLALAGPHRAAPGLNVLFSLLTFAATLVLAQRTVTHGPAFAFNQLFFVDPLNVFLVALTAFVGWTTAIFSKPYMRNEREHGRMSANRLRLFHSMYQLFVFAMLLALMDTIHEHEDGAARNVAFFAGLRGLPVRRSDCLVGHSSAH